ncbi:NAD(P)H-dependent glycerol-3-phosphate dehydrogenase [Cucumibacter marinus]|uniref:NAD(P)H-dependent glycerol-3-phosphate dehydrogenase n=1 Tax=Cucumibacter marinus TaxID=1121252 RepID=UPI0003F960DC|nr:NAD(P)H-dependent glycerol-3-phosphate dehydrogenase [Cucumibacter marinus]
MTAKAKVYVVGAGAWGTALAQAAALGGCDVTLCGRNPAVISAVNDERRNPFYISDAPIAEGVSAQIGTGGLGAADFVLLVVPAQESRNALGEISPQALAGMPVVLCAKGLEKGTMLRPSQVLQAAAPQANPLVLSGPSFASEVARGKPTAVTIAGEDEALTELIAHHLAGPTFRLYAAGDMTGVELAGALKNVYAIACGAVQGADLGLSARSSVLARAFAEMSRLVAEVGGKPQTLTGLAGLGDLTLSCTSRESRNFDFGWRLGAGQTLAELTGEGAKLAEGRHSAPVAKALANEAGVDVPIIDAVNALIEGHSDIAGLVEMLMTRPLKRDVEI